MQFSNGLINAELRLICKERIAEIEENYPFKAVMGVESIFMGDDVFIKEGVIQYKIYIRSLDPIIKDFYIGFCEHSCWPNVINTMGTCGMCGCSKFNFPLLERRLIDKYRNDNFSRRNDEEKWEETIYKMMIRKKQMISYLIKWKIYFIQTKKAIKLIRKYYILRLYRPTDGRISNFLTQRYTADFL